MDNVLLEGGSLDIFIDLVKYEGDWESIPVEGVISIEIIFTSPIEVLADDGTESGDSVPGFSILLVLSSVLCAVVVSRRRH